MEAYPKIIVTRAKLVVDYKCPKCRSTDIKAMHEISSECRNCKSRFTVEPNIDIYYSISKKIEQVLGENNGVILTGERDDSKRFHPDDMLKPRSRQEDEVFKAMLAVKHTKDKQLCWDVDKDIVAEYDEDYRTYCNQCGHCLNCVTCKKCNKIYTPKRVKTRVGTEKRYTCPECNSKNYHHTHINQFGMEANKPVCPYCKSEAVLRTQFNSNLKSCPVCKKKDISKPRQIPVYRLVIKRQPRFSLER
jgi:transposase-like protein